MRWYETAILVLVILLLFGCASRPEKKVYCHGPVYYIKVEVPK